MSATSRSRYSLVHLSHDELECDLHAHAGRDRTTTADLLAHIAEHDRRKRYIPAGFSSMHVYCTSRLLFSGDMAYKRIRVARAARRFPAIYGAIADGGLNVSGVVLLAPKLMVVKRDEGRALLRAALGKSKAQIEQLLAERFPQPDLPSVIRMISATPSALEEANNAEVPVGVGPESSEVGAGAAPTEPVSSTCLMPLAPGPVASAKPEFPATCATTLAASHAPRPRIAPLSPKRYSLQLTIDESTHDKLRRAQELLSHAVPSGDVAQVLDRALDALIQRLEQRKFAKTDRPRSDQPDTTSRTRHIPAQVKRAVYARDGGQCTYVSDAGHRCTSKTRLEYDHIEAFARGGASTVDNIQLRCRTHNEYAAEQAFGAGFMSRKREAAQRAAMNQCVNRAAT